MEWVATLVITLVVLALGFLVYASVNAEVALSGFCLAQGLNQSGTMTHRSIYLCYNDTAIIMAENIGRGWNNFTFRIKGGSHNVQKRGYGNDSQLPVGADG
jgi:hypothetical protein